MINNKARHFDICLFNAPTLTLCHHVANSATPTTDSLSLSPAASLHSPVSCLSPANRDPQWQIGKICGTDNDQPELAEFCIAPAPARAPTPSRTATGRRWRLSRFELKWILLLLLLHELLLPLLALLLLLLTCSQWANLPYAGKMTNWLGCWNRNSSQVSGCPTLPCQDSLLTR